MLRLLRRTMIGTGLIAGATCGYVYYATDGQLTPQRVWLTTLRSTRVLIMAAKMGFVYKFANKPMEEKHRIGSQIMLDAFKKNGGLYVKLGQLIASVGQLTLP